MLDSAAMESENPVPVKGSPAPPSEWFPGAAILARLMPLLLAVLFTGLNAIKPLQIDDTAYEYFARNIAENPLDPYGFAMFWYTRPEPANGVLAPPVLPYWWALVRSLVGEEPILWKLGLFPWAMLLAHGLNGLLLRFARPLATWLLPALMISPALLPSFNLMLDIPALALSTSALHWFLKAVDDRRPGLAVLAGLLMGLGMQTKYTVFVLPAVLLVYATLRCRWLLWLAATVTALQVFVGWECLISLVSGRSHFLLNMPSETDWLQKIGQMTYLGTHLGGVGMVGVLFGLAALGVRRGWLILGGILVLGTLGSLVLVEGWVRTEMQLSPSLFGSTVMQAQWFSLGEVLFFGWAVVGAVVLIVAAWRLVWRECGVLGQPFYRSQSVFLLAWLVLEVLAFPALTPFPAVRRVLGVMVAASLLLARLGARHTGRLWREGTLAVLVVGNVLLGAGFWALDCQGAWAQAEAARRAAEWVRAFEPKATLWYVGHWGFQYYAERQGMQPVIPDYIPPPGRIAFPSPSLLRPGDWLIVPDKGQNQPSIEFEPEKLELVTTIPIGFFPLRTVPNFYGGFAPIHHQESPTRQVWIFRVCVEYTPRVGTPPELPAP